MTTLIPNLPLQLIPLTNSTKDVDINAKYHFFNTEAGLLKADDIISVSSDRYIIDSVGRDVFQMSKNLDIVSIGWKNNFKRNNKKRAIRY